MAGSHRDLSDWDSFRCQMPVTEKWVYFDHAAVSPLSEPARKVIVDWAQQAANEGGACWLQWSQQVEEVRKKLAKLIGASWEEVALVRNTTSGIGLVADGFDWQQGDNVVLPAGEFPSNLYPWMNLATRGVEARRVEMEPGQLDLDRLAAACDRRTRIISVSWVGYADGWRSDVSQLAK
ncbi:MAG: aminotransferase class V-fold PLP-dependent enzyme, partial [Planctomycetales bacterium]